MPVIKILSWNTRELVDQSKHLALKRSLKKLNPNLVLIQETKRDTFDSSIIRALWSSKDIGWTFVEAYGKTGGILTMWDESKISVVEVLKGVTL